MPEEGTVVAEYRLKGCTVRICSDAFAGASAQEIERRKTAARLTAFSILDRIERDKQKG